MSVDKEKVVCEFIDQFKASWPEDIEAALDGLADDVSYQMVVPTFEPCKGKAAVIEAIKTMKTKVADQKHDMVNVAAAGNVVFTERVDYSFRNNKWVPVPLVAVFEVNDEGKIVSWREYLDVYNNMLQHGHSFEDMKATINT